MRRLFSTALLIAAVAVTVQAQRRDTTFATLAADLSTAATLTVPPSALIGQTQHTFTVVLNDAVGQTCTGGFVSMAAQGSHNGAAWVTIGAPLTNIQQDQYGVLIGLARADQAYPFVRFVVSSFDTANCVATVFYAGTLAPIAGRPRALLYPIYAIPSGNDEASVSEPISTDGLTAHASYVRFVGCTAGAIVYTLQGAWESGGPWVNIGQSASITSPNVPGELLARGWGSYPLVRVAVASSTNTSCSTALVYYWGSNEPPDPFYLGGKHVVRTTSYTHTDAAVSTVLAGSDYAMRDLLHLSVIVPCSGVSATVVWGNAVLLNAVQGPYVWTLPLTGHSYLRADAGDDLQYTFTTAGSGCKSAYIQTARLVVSVP